MANPSGSPLEPRIVRTEATSNVGFGVWPASATRLDTTRATDANPPRIITSTADGPACPATTVVLDKYVIMPDHVHGIIIRAGEACLGGPGDSGRSNGVVSRGIILARARALSR
jgi:hypothetical protein